VRPSKALPRREQRHDERRQRHPRERRLTISREAEREENARCARLRESFGEVPP
jgi:hypothetical protein